MTDMPELTDAYLNAVANAERHDPHYLYKQSGRKQRDAVLAIIRPTPAPPAAPETTTVSAALSEMARTAA